MEVLVLGMDFFFFKINLFVGFGQAKKMGFDLGLSDVICMYVNLTMCAVIFEEREREIWGPFGHRVQNLLFKNM